MSIKMFKPLLAGCILLASFIANAGFMTMSISDDGTDLLMTATGDYDNTGLQAISVGASLGANAAVASSTVGNLFGWETDRSSEFAATYAGVITSLNSVFPADSVITTNPFFFNSANNSIHFQENAPLVGTVNESATFIGVTLDSLGMISGQSLTVNWGTNQAIIQTSPMQVPVSVPSTLAIFGLALMGLALRQFKKQS